MASNNDRDDEQDTEDQSAILSRRRALLVSALASMSAGTAACEKIYPRPCLSVEPINRPEPCLAVPFQRADAATGPVVIHPCLSPMNPNRVRLQTDAATNDAASDASTAPPEPPGVPQPCLSRVIAPRVCLTGPGRRPPPPQACLSDIPKQSPDKE